MLADELAQSVSEAAAVVVRWDLGGRPGLEVIEQVASCRPDLPIVLCDDKPSREHVVLAIGRGAKSVILHPFELEELLERVGELPTGPAEGEDETDDGASDEGASDEGADDGADEA